ncbi:hypothetical protein BBK82_05120 [Lentzea guizhouensis]|uniref:DUF2637 domain-containing protein n=1 Tax=Lentzea guizhouensis TaxID=1586287 RepID=A0A1B2HCU2_9PSEU|nr:DUF2637 domain-containing protein [Lentzea guizhouensis]ANZ35554.1 hypothetical protein BBK82_05120 [Lentzea guizhouensis]
MRKREQAEGLDWVTWMGAAVLLASVAVLSFSTLMELAVRGGYTDWRKWLWPLSLDAAAMVALRYWLARGLPASARRTGLALALVVIILSTGGNALEHWWQGGLLAAVMGSIPPLVLAAVALLIDLGLRRQDLAPDTPAHAPAAAPGPGELVTSDDAAPDVQSEACDEATMRPLRRDLSERLVQLELLTTKHPTPAPGAEQTPRQDPVPPGLDLALVKRAHELIAKSEGAPGFRRIGRDLLARELGTSPHQARLQLAHYDATNSTTPGAGADTKETASA